MRFAKAVRVFFLVIHDDHLGAEVSPRFAHFAHLESGFRCVLPVVQGFLAVTHKQIGCKLASQRPSGLA